MKTPLVIIAGPTAVGKTELSIGLAKAAGGSIISADSMQVYRHMDIGSAKVTREQMQGIPHYLIDVLEPEEEFNVSLFKEMAAAAIGEIRAAGRIPIVCGGTGFYIQALLYDVDFAEQPPDAAYRESLAKIAREEGLGRLHEMLREVDPESAAAIHENNQKRVTRALEYHHLTGEKISEHNARQRGKDSPYNFAYFVITDDRDAIYKKIDSRVDEMVRDGLLDEVRGLKERGISRDAASMQGLGYKQMLSCLDGERSLDDAISAVKRETRHYAKRQLTWFRRERDVIWVDRRDFGCDGGRILSYMLGELSARGILD